MVHNHTVNEIETLGGQLKECRWKYTRDPINPSVHSHPLLKIPPNEHTIIITMNGQKCKLDI